MVIPPNEKHTIKRWCVFCYLLRIIRLSPARKTAADSQMSIDDIRNEYRLRTDDLDARHF